MLVPAADIFGPKTGAIADPGGSLLDDVQIMSLPDPEWVVQDVIPKGGRVGWVAPPDSFKTTALADLLVAVATGQDWHGHPVVRRGPSLYLGAEERSGFKVR